MTCLGAKLLSRAVSNLIVKGMGVLATLVIQPDNLYKESDVPRR